MDQIAPGLWIGDLPSAQDAANLKAHKIFSILSAMRGRITINETFIRRQIQLDDTEDADILMHFLPCIHFIQAELDKGRGVLVHCMAGISRSSTIVAAYLMYSQKITPQEALDLIRKARPQVDPNAGFMTQLELFHAARYKISRREKAVRMFYMDRAVEEVMNGDGSLPETTMFAKYPNTPTDSTPGTPVAPPRRRIRCKMCRQELAAREHMLDHGQLGPATPAATTPAASRRPSMNAHAPLSRSGSMSARRSFGQGLSDSLAMSSIQEKPAEPSEPPIAEEDTLPVIKSNTPGGRALEEFRNAAQLDASVSNMSALEDDDEGEDATAEDISIEASRIIGRRLSDAVGVASKTGGGDETATTQVIKPADLVAELYANPKIMALRTPGPISNQNNGILKSVSVASAPILVNPKCSGYFLEPMKWMEHFLSSGQLAGKITCPNKKCNAKLGNFDWAGVCCGCKQWVTPGFCVNRSKVDEVL